MSKRLISILLVSLLFAIPLAVFMMPDTGSLESERRLATAFPKVPSKLRSRDIKTFFKRLDAFFADHFPLRTSLLSLSKALHEVNDDSLDTTRCYRGRKDWLFLGNNYEYCVDKLRGKMTLSGNELKQLTEAYQARRDAAEKSGAEFFVFIGPNKSTVYPEYLPPVVQPSRRRFLSPLVDSLSETGVKIYDPTNRLIQAKAAGFLLYYRTDTHWNARGAYEAFEGFRKWAALPALPSFSFTDAPAQGGDLVDIGGYKVFPISPGDNFTLHWRIPPALHEEGDLVTNAQAASDKTVWVFGDSFAMALRPYITATFKEVRFFPQGEFETAMSSQSAKPDMVLWVVVERRFTHPI